MELLEKVVIDRARNIFLTEETLEGALQIAESSSYAYVAEQDSRKSGLKAKKRTVENQISNLTNTAIGRRESRRIEVHRQEPHRPSRRNKRTWKKRSARSRMTPRNCVFM